MELFFDFSKKFNLFDSVYIIITLWSVLSCLKKGFVLSILSASKWLLAYILTLFFFPKIKPYTDGFLDNEYILDLILGVSTFVIIIFLILLINKGISRAVSYSGLGSLDRFFGFFFGFIKAYIISVCVYSTINIVYNHNKWPINLKKSYSFEWVEKGSNYLIKEFPNEKQYNNAKDKVQEL